MLQNLLAEGISIRNLAGIPEKLAITRASPRIPTNFLEYARRALGNIIGQTVPVGKRPPAPSRSIQTATNRSRRPAIPDGDRVTARSETCAACDDDIIAAHPETTLADGHQPLVLCAPQIRPAFRRFFESTFSDLSVLSAPMARRAWKSKAPPCAVSGITKEEI